MRTTVERLSKSSASSRRRIVPINQRDFESIRDATSIGSRTARSNKSSIHTRNGISLPNINDRSNIFDQKSQANKKRK
ncbi:unnamed protein product, partial [Adineta steineri]